MSTALLVVSYPNGASNTNVLPLDRALAWADRIASDDRASHVWVVFPTGEFSTIK